MQDKGTTMCTLVRRPCAAQPGRHHVTLCAVLVQRSAWGRAHRWWGERATGRLRWRMRTLRRVRLCRYSSALLALAAASMRARSSLQASGRQQRPRQLLYLLNCACGVRWLRLCVCGSKQVIDSRSCNAAQTTCHASGAQTAVALLRKVMLPISKQAGIKAGRAAAYLPTTVSSSPAMGTPRRPEISAGQPGPTLCTLRPCGSFRARTCTAQAQL